MALRNVKPFPDLHVIATRKFIKHGVVVRSVIAGYVADLKEGI
jgi:hypothetical protein